MSFAFKSPDARAETAARIRECSRSSATRPHPVARMLTQRRTDDDRDPDAAGTERHLQQPLLRRVQRGRRPRRRGAGYGLAFHLADARQRFPARSTRATVDGSSPSAVGRPPRGRADPPGRPADRARRLGRAAGAGSVEVDDVGGARAAAPTSPASAIETSSSSGSEPPERRRRSIRRSVTGRRLRGYREGRSPPSGGTRRWPRVVGPASIEGGLAATIGAWAGRTAPDRDPGDVGRHGDRRAAGAPRPTASTSRATSASWASMTSTSRRTSTHH